MALSGPQEGSHGLEIHQAQPQALDREALPASYPAEYVGETSASKTSAIDTVETLPRIGEQKDAVTFLGKQVEREKCYYISATAAVGVIVSLIIAVIVLVATASPHNQAPFATPQVDLGYEIHQGVFNATGQFYNFSNIPYAAPPVGNLRFKPPTSPSSTTKVVNDGSRFAICPQGIPAWTTVSTKWLTQGLGSIDIAAGYTPPNITKLPPVQYGTSEDCLLLNVLVPKAIFEAIGTGKGAPVMVWIHGGGYTLGWNSLYGSGAGLVRASLSNRKKGVIYVALNYRLGLFGFLSGPTFQSQGGTPNLGLLDQRFALEWVQKNIAKFGGDPNQVTVMGESAGGGSVIHQITAYGGTKGKVPFQRAISQSGAFLMTPSTGGSLARQERIFQNFLSNASVSTLDQARGLSTEKLQLINAKLVGEAPYGDFTFNPVVDSTFAPSLPSELLAAGKYDTSLSLLIGYNGNEGLFFTSPFVFSASTFKSNVLLVSFPDVDTTNTSSYILSTLYPSSTYTSPILRGDAIVSESVFSCNAHYLSTAFQNNAWSYLFNITPALHGNDISYTFYEGPAPAVTKPEIALKMQLYITNFVSGGDPNGVGLERFEKYGNGGFLEFGDSGVRAVSEEEGRVERCGWWQRGEYYLR